MRGGDVERAWRKAAVLAPEHALALPFAGEHVAVVGSGIALSMGRAYAAFREDASQGPTDAAPPDELALRRYHRAVLLSPTGEEPTLVELVERLREEAILAIGLGTPAGTPVAELAGVTVPFEPALGPGDPITAWATTAFAVLRSHLSAETGGSAATAAMRAALPDTSGVRRWIVVGHRWSLGMAEAAAGALRRAGADAVAGPPSEVTAGELGDADAGTLVWSFDEPADELSAWAAVREAPLRAPSIEPIGELLLAQRIADAMRAG